VEAADLFIREHVDCRKRVWGGSGVPEPPEYRIAVGHLHRSYFLSSRVAAGHTGSFGRDKFSRLAVVVFLAVGSCIGPIVMLGFALYERLTDPHSGGFWVGGGFLFLATAVSCTTTLIYLWLIRRADGLSHSS
jgi:hypothetical protein